MMASITNLDNFNSDQHFTPKELFDALSCSFDLDVAGFHGQTHVPAKKVFCHCCHNGLVDNWEGLVWMNPPYSKPTPWIERFIEHNNGLALIPITRGKWWDKVWQSNGHILPTAYNFKFIRPDGVKRDITFRTMLWGLGELSYRALVQSNLGRVR
jgi:hypothetical protein